MQTRNGTRVTKLMKLENCYVGLVNGTLMQWSLEGRRTGRNKSKFDLQLQESNPVYANVYINRGVKRVTAKRFSSIEEAKKNATTGYVKTIEL